MGQRRWKEQEPPLRVRASVMTISLDLPKQILNAQIEARKPERRLIRRLGESGHETWDTCHNHCDRGPRFAIKFWRWITSEPLWVQIRIRACVQSQTDGQSKRTISTLRIYVACLVQSTFGNGLWINTIAIVEFSYNNSYHASIKAAPFEALYGRKCRSPVCWTEVGEAQILGPELIQETTEKIIQIKQQDASPHRDRQKS
ncbi:putative reverse transcriptase domain-containing protein [Tanacetum coccineum]|uniref:Reverse transcriptase domain-containing protein n=1 Tax=Tanacetum coccineum TaxID=301880 RepID=A0ABQ5AHG6_9ASTR